MRLFAWLIRAFIFFTLFAFALNNQQTATVNWFFGVHWRAPMVIVVLVAFAAGCVLATLAMLPGWWRQRQKLASTPARGNSELAAHASARTGVGAQTSGSTSVASSASQAPAVDGV